MSASGVISNIVTVLGTVTSVKSVHQSPVLADEWLKVFGEAGYSNCPAVHVGLKDNVNSEADTDNGEAETLSVRLTVVQPHTDSTLADLLTLRDAIRDKVYATSNLTQGGEADDTHMKAFEVLEDQGEYTVWALDLDVLVLWERA